MFPTYLPFSNPLSTRNIMMFGTLKIKQSNTFGDKTSAKELAIKGALHIIWHYIASILFFGDIHK
jgi:hypothetical protein